MSDDVVILVLLGGQEIICTKKDNVINDPMNIISQPLPNGQSNVHFVPAGAFAFGLNPISDFNFSLVLFSYKPTQQVVEKYQEIAQNIRAKSSGIIIPKMGQQGQSVDRR